MKRYERGELVSQLPSLPCYCADHSQLSDTPSL